MPIEDREAIAHGTVLYAIYKHSTYRCMVEQPLDQPRSYLLEDGTRYPTPSAAASAVTKGSVNGWKFWSIEGDVPPVPKVSRRVQANGHSKTNSSNLFRNLKRLSPGENDPKGLIHWFCSSCMDGWYLPQHKHPATCPEGHPEYLDPESFTD